MVQRLRGVPEARAARVETARDIAASADDDAHAARITKRLYISCEFWPTPKQIEEAAIVERMPVASNRTNCSLCGGTGIAMTYALSPRRRLPTGELAIGKSEPLTRQEYDVLTKTLPNSPLDWRPTDRGLLLAFGVPCSCRAVQPAKDEEKQSTDPGGDSERDEPWEDLGRHR
jgi:hypothetical protein